ncbi:hypothetical protein Tco_0834546 [Tanacetum coccineum]
MNPTNVSQIALDNALVPPEARLNIGECNRRIEFSKPQREATYQITLDALKLSPCYPAFLITPGVPEIYMHHFDIPPSTDEDIVSFIYELGYTGNIKTLPELAVDHMHQPWRTFAAVINKCIFEKTTGHDKLRINLHTARDDSLLGTLKYVSKTEERQVYGALIPKEMINEDILKSTAYHTYFAYSSGAKEPKKTRKFKKPALPKQKSVPGSPKEPTKKTTKKPGPAKKKAPAKGVPDEKQCKISGTDKGTGTKPGVPDVPKYDSESDKESWGDSGEEEEDDDDKDDSVDKSDDDKGDDDDDDNDDNDDDSDDERTESDRDKNSNINKSNKEHEKDEE